MPTLHSLFMIGLCTLLPTHQAATARPDLLAFTRVTVIDGTGTSARPEMTVVIAGNRIRAMGKAGTIPLPARARVVSATGKFMIPGLWDMHVHWYDESSLALFLANGVTGVRIMCGFPLHLQWRRAVADGKLLGPRLVLAGPIVDGTDPVWPDSIRASNLSEGRGAVRSIQNQGYDCVKVYNLLPRSAFFGVTDEARMRGLPVVGHVPFSVSADEASDAGQQSIEHLTGVSFACSSQETRLRQELTAMKDPGEPPTSLLLRFEVQAEDSYDALKAAALFARFAKNGTWQVPTLTVRQSHAALRDPASGRSPLLRYLPSSVRGRWDSRRTATFKKLRPEDFANFKRVFQTQLKLVRDMHRAGVRMLAGTDTGALDCFPGFSLHDELELLVQAGLTPMEALQAATRNPAQFLNQLDDRGTVERGKLADLVLLDANPLNDIRNTRKLRAVVVNGRLLKKADLDALLDAAETAAREKQEPERLPGMNSKYP
jgi:imidazolonepropionase-like amidohydrolase